MTGYKNDFASLFKNLNDLYELMDKEFYALFKVDDATAKEKIIVEQRSESRLRDDP